MTREEMIADAQAAKDAGDFELEQHIYGLLEAMPEKPEKSAPSRFLSGVGGKVLEAAGAASDAYSGLTGGFSPSGEWVKQKAQEGLQNSLANDEQGITAGDAGKFMGAALPYLALPGGSLPAAIAQNAGTAALTTPGSLEDRAKSAGITAGFTGAAPGVGMLAGKAANLAGGGVANIIGALGTHTGGESIKQAAKAGFEGGSKAEAFTHNLRGGSMDDVLTMARDNISNLGAQKAAQYRSGMVDIKGDKSVLKFDAIDDALNNANGIVTYKGQVTNESAANYLAEINKKVSEWKALNPNEFHTPEGLDQLKQVIGGIQEKIPLGDKTALKAVGGVYNAIKDSIVAQAPKYAKVMKDYSTATKALKEVENSLSLGKKSLDDTALRKLQSVMRNNANTNYGNRVSSVLKLEQGGNDLMPSLAGQALNSWTPRGLGGLAMVGNVGYGAANPVALSLLPLQSPRLIGEAAFKGGQAANLINKAADKVPNKAALASILYQMGNQ